MVDARPPTPTQIATIVRFTGLNVRIIKKIYHTFGHIYEDAGNLGMKAEFGVTVTSTDITRSLRNVFSLLLDLMKRQKIQQEEIVAIWNGCSNPFRKAAIDLVRGMLSSTHGKWDGDTPPLSEMIRYLPDTLEEFDEVAKHTPIDPNTDVDIPLPDEISIDTNNTSTEEEPKPLQLNLNYPDKEILDVKIDRLRDNLLIPEETVREIIVHLSSGRHVLLAGPIGTGKSALAKLLGGFWAESEPHADAAGGYHCREFSANNDWSTQDVIGGIVPVLKSDDQKEDNGDVGYRYHEGCFLETLKENLEIYTVKKREFLQDRPYDEVKDRMWTQSNKKGYMGTWLVIDELNRADIDKAFGPLLSALESGTLSVPDHPDPIYRNIPIPGNFRIIATLNTSDRHYLYKLSDALKRRFAYVEIKSPDLDLREEEIESAHSSAIRASGLAKEGDKPVPFDEIDDGLKTSLIKSYQFLTSIRSVKDLGTAVLKSIYQTILMGTGKGGLDENSVLDAALTSNLIPQMDSLSEESLEMLSILYFEDEPVKSLHRIRGDTANRERFQKESGMFLQTMAVWNFDSASNLEIYKTHPSVFGNTFSNNDWDATRVEFQKLWGTSPWKLPHFQAALAELKNQASM